MFVESLTYFKKIWLGITALDLLLSTQINMQQYLRLIILTGFNSTLITLKVTYTKERKLLHGYLHIYIVIWLIKHHINLHFSYIP